MRSTGKVSQKGRKKAVIVEAVVAYEVVMGKSKEIFVATGDVKKLPIVEGHRVKATLLGYRAKLKGSKDDEFFVWVPQQEIEDSTGGWDKEVWEEDADGFCSV